MTRLTTMAATPASTALACGDANMAMNGFDPVFGARPLRRLVQSAIGDQLAKELLSGDVPRSARTKQRVRYGNAADPATRRRTRIGGVPFWAAA